MKLIMFPGQGSQYPGMGKDWCENFKESKLAFEEASDGSGLDLKKICFESSEEELKKTDLTQPAILTTTVAIFRAIAANKGIPLSKNIFAGHSLGEYSALVCMGALDLASAARLVNHRGLYMQQAVPAGVGAMAALVFKPKVDGSSVAAALCKKIAQETGQWVSVANFNSPEQIVVAGHATAVAALNMLATEDASYNIRKVVELPVSAPFHCGLMKPAADKLALELKQAIWKPCEARYIANIDAKTHSCTESSAIAGRLVDQICGSVRWVESVQEAIRQGASSAIEIGPGKVLSGLVKRISLDGVTLEAKNIDKVEDFKNDDFSFA